jgi:F0F1-type ATP synthase alpha subunit
VKEVAAWEKGFLEFMLNQKPEVREELASKKDLSDELVQKIEASIAEYQAQYAAGGTGAKKQEREAVAV